jgi:hypothetical protein
MFSSGRKRRWKSERGILYSCLVQFGSRNLAAYEAESDQQDPGWRWEYILNAASRCRRKKMRQCEFWLRAN